MLIPLASQSVRMAIVATVERRQIRYAHMVGVTPEIMKQGMRADYRLVDSLSTKLCERMRTAKTLRVQTPFGTKLHATFDPALAARVSSNRCADP